jgi:DNA-binding IclR family transcriptional regulator
MAFTRNQIIASAAATLEILEVLGNADSPMALGAVVAAIGRPKGTVHRMLSTLVNTGFACQDPGSGRYGLTLKAWRIGSKAVRDLDLVKQALPVLEGLMADAGETVHLAVLDPSGGTVYVAKVESPQSIRVQTRLGQLNPAWCTATGRSLLAFNEDVAERVLAHPLERRTPRTITDRKKVREKLAEVRMRGYAVTLAENHPEMRRRCAITRARWLPRAASPFPRSGCSPPWLSVPFRRCCVPRARYRRRWAIPG